MEKVTVIGKNVEIDSRAFRDCTDFVVRCYEGLTVEEFCKTNVYSYEYIV